jgi:hypothetical protein
MLQRTLLHLTTLYKRLVKLITPSDDASARADLLMNLQQEIVAMRQENVAEPKPGRSYLVLFAALFAFAGIICIPHLTSFVFIHTGYQQLVNTTLDHGHFVVDTNQTWFDVVNSTAIWSLDLADASLREPSCIYSLYLNGCIVLSLIAFEALYFFCRFFNKFKPIHHASWVDWMYPPIEIPHKINTKDGVKILTANEMRSHLTIESFRLKNAFLAKDNQHGESAQRRAAAVNMMTAIAKRLGKTVYDENMSRRSAKAGNLGSRVIMDAKDGCSYQNRHLKHDAIPDNALIMNVDTFTHKNIHDANDSLTSDNINGILTWNPTEVAGTSDEVKFRFDDAGDFITSGAGFGDYRDRLFDFEDDILVTSSHRWAWTRRTVVCLSLAVTILAYNMYANHIHNRTLLNLGSHWWKYYDYTISYPVPTFYRFSNQTTYYSDLMSLPLTFGLSGSWWATLDGYIYPSYFWSTIMVPYYWIAEPQTLTYEHYLVVASLLISAMYNSYTTVTVCHKVYRIDIGESRTVVFVVPNCRFEGLSTYVRPFLYESCLKFRTPAVSVDDSGHKFLAMKTKEPAGFSVSYLDSFTSHFLPYDTVDTAKCLSSKTGSPSISNVRISTKTETGTESSRVAIAIAISMITQASDLPAYSSNYGFYPVPTIIRQTDEEAADGKKPKPVMAHGAMNAVVKHAAYVHAKSEGAHDDLVERRLKAPAAKVDTTITPEIAGYIAEFALHMRIDVFGKDMPGMLMPVSEDVYVKSRSKNQLNKFNEVVNIYDINGLEDREGFMKREVLADATKAARGICMYGPSHQALGGRISLAYADALKSCAWVACGLNPAEITAKVVSVCAGATGITDTDFSAQDATIDLEDRTIELMLLHNLFSEEYHELIDHWHWTDYAGRVLYGEKGTKKAVHIFKGSRGSGSPFTTYGNTPLTGLFAYIGLRIQGLESDAAYKQLGAYSGDDGLTADLETSACDAAAKALGFIVKTSTNETYIPFLGRNYFDPIGGSNSSIHSPLRTLAKLHTTLVDINEFTAEEAMIMKAICLLTTDADSDFFGLWARKIVKDAGEKQTQALKSRILKYPGLHTYFAITALKTKTTFNGHGGDFVELFEKEMPGFNWALFGDWIENGTGPCPTLWEQAEPTDDAMDKVAPVTLAMNGVDDDSHKIEYLARSKETFSFFVEESEKEAAAEQLTVFLAENETETPNPPAPVRKVTWRDYALGAADKLSGGWCLPIRNSDESDNLSMAGDDGSDEVSDPIKFAAYLEALSLQEETASSLAAEARLDKAAKSPKSKPETKSAMKSPKPKPESKKKDSRKRSEAEQQKFTAAITAIGKLSDYRAAKHKLDGPEDVNKANFKIRASIEAKAFPRSQ